MSQSCRECVRGARPGHCEAFIDGRPRRCADDCEWFEPHPLTMQRDRLLALLREARDRIFKLNNRMVREDSPSGRLLSRIDAEIGGEK